MELLGNTHPQEHWVRHSQRGFNGTAQGVLPHPAPASVATGRPLHIFGDVVCFSLLSSSVPLRFGISCRVNLFLHSTGPLQSRAVTHLELSGIDMQLLKEQNQCKFSACSSCFMVLKQQNTTLPPPPFSNLAPPSPWSRGLTESGYPRFGQCSPQRAPRTFPWTHHSCKCPTRLFRWAPAQDLNLWWGTSWHSCCYKVRPNPHKWGYASS